MTRVNPSGKTNTQRSPASATSPGTPATHVSNSQSIHSRTSYSSLSFGASPASSQVPPRPRYAMDPQTHSASEPVFHDAHDVHFAHEFKRGIFIPVKAMTDSVRPFSKIVFAVLWNAGGGVYLTYSEALDAITWAHSKGMAPSSEQPFDAAPTIDLNITAAMAWLLSNLVIHTPAPTPTRQPPQFARAPQQYAQSSQYQQPTSAKQHQPPHVSSTPPPSSQSSSAGDSLSDVQRAIQYINSVAPGFKDFIAARSQSNPSSGAPSAAPNTPPPTPITVSTTSSVQVDPPAAETPPKATTDDSAKGQLLSTRDWVLASVV